MIKSLSLLLLLLGLGAAAAGASSIPSVANSTLPKDLPLVGHAGSAADPVGSATFVLRLASNTPIPGAAVVLDFSACSDLRLSTDALEPGFTLDCTQRRITGTTDIFGQVTFRIVGAGNGGPPRALPACVAAYGNGVPLGSFHASAFDLDGMNGVSAADGSMLARDLFSGQYRARSDFDGDGDLDAIDLGLFARALFGGGSPASGAANCGP
jgi:hypothetical protein